MEQQLKQRLVGVGVIFALAVIFLPLLLDGSGRRPENLTVTIPPRPHIASDIRVETKVIELRNELKKIPVREPVFIDEVNSPPGSGSDQASDKAPAPEQKASASSDKVVEPAKVPAKTTVAKTDPTPAKVEPQVGGDSWIIQVGSFSSKDKAYQFRNKLRESKLSSVFIEQYKHEGSTRFRVRMGPFIEQKKAKIIQNKVLAKYNVNGLVMRYEK